jgi:nitrogen fixation-related uncharacterized protein
MSDIQASTGFGSGTAPRVAVGLAGKPAVPGTFRHRCPLFGCRRFRHRGVSEDVGSILTLLVVVAIVAGVVWLVRQQQATKTRELDDAKADARRWVERLGGQVLSLVGTNDAAKQALADAAERYTAAGSQMDQARTAAQARGVTETAYEGLYYVRAARTAMDMDPGPELPPLPGQQQAGAVTEAREVEVEGHRYGASPNATGRNTHFYPGGVVAGRPVPRGWYSEPWWRPALVAGAWGLGSALLFSSMFSGMSGVAYADGYADGMAADGMDGGDPGADFGGDQGGDFGDTGGDWGGDFGGGDWGGGGDFF